MLIESHPENQGARRLSAIANSLDDFSPTLKLVQRLHAGGIILIPITGSIAAITFAIRFGISFIDVAMLALMYGLTSMGITVGFHRHFAHVAFQTDQSVRIILAILGSMACQGPIVYWVSNHRRHHQYSDKPGDIHSPYYHGDRPLGKLAGFWHSHAGWTFEPEITNTFLFAKDLLRDRGISKVNQFYYLWLALSLLLPTVLEGIWVRSWSGALSGFLWGGCVRLALTYHITNSINSITHLYGRRPFDTQEHSTNNIWLAIPTAGEAWHNNHHAFPNSAVFGFQWWQVDLGGWVVRILERMGLIWNIKVPTPRAIEAKRNGAGLC